MPREKRKERKLRRVREDIISAAARVFAGHGYSGATMEKIAREAGYSTPSLYTYFESKGALVDALLECFVDDLLSVYDRPQPRGLTLEQRLELMLHEVFVICERRRDALLALATAANTVPFPACLVLDADAEVGELPTIFLRFIQWLKENAPPGGLGSSTPVDAAYLLYGIVYTSVMRWHHTGRKERLTALVPLSLELFFHGVRGAPNKRESPASPEDHQ